MGRREKAKTVRDRIVPVLINQARLEMMNVYRPGAVEPLGRTTVGITMSTQPLGSICGPFLEKDFYAIYKMAFPLRPLIPVRDPSCREVLQGHVSSKIEADLKFKDVDGKDHTLIIYMIDFHVTRDGEVWHEESDGVWRKVLQLPHGLLQACYLNLRANLNVKYEV